LGELGERVASREATRSPSQLLYTVYGASIFPYSALKLDEAAQYYHKSAPIDVGLQES